MIGFFAGYSMVGWCSAENINCRDSAGRNSTPLHLAAGYNNLEVSKFNKLSADQGGRASDNFSGNPLYALQDHP